MKNIPFVAIIVVTTLHIFISQCISQLVLQPTTTQQGNINYVPSVGINPVIIIVLIWLFFSLILCVLDINQKLDLMAFAIGCKESGEGIVILFVITLCLPMLFGYRSLIEAKHSKLFSVSVAGLISTFGAMLGIGLTHPIVLLLFVFSILGLALITLWANRN
jgi:hypothetical protein